MQFVRALAEFEDLDDQVVSDEGSLLKYLFGKRPYAEAIISEIDGNPAGFVILFYSFSSFRGRPGLYIEDTFVYPEYRNKGVGRALMEHCARLALQQGCIRMEWSALDWNPARNFYEHLGAEAHKEWIMYRLEGKALLELAGADA